MSGPNAGGTYLSNDGHWDYDRTRKDIPEDLPSVGFGAGAGVVWRTPYVNPEIWEQSAVAPAPQNIWESIKFLGATWARAIADVPIPRAEWDAVGRGAALPVMQHPSVVSGNAGHAGREDRYGPFRDPRMSQQAILAYLASALPAEVSGLEARMQVGGTIGTPGYGASGG